MVADDREPGRVEAAVGRDLQVLGAAVDGTALAEMALVMARAMDAFSSRALDGTPAEMSALAKAHQELRVTLGVLREVAARVGDGGEDAAELSTPVWSDGAAARDAADAGAADVGSAGGGGGAAAG